MSGKPKSALAWWFGPDDRRLGYEDGRHVRKGRTHKVKGPLRMCCKGLHASRNILDAVSYGKGDWVWRVRLTGEWRDGYDKLCATERTYLWGFKATETLRHFARLCALKVVDEWDAPDEVKVFLNSGSEKLRDAAYESLPRGNLQTEAAACAIEVIDFPRISGRRLAEYCSWDCCAVSCPHSDDDDPDWIKERKVLGKLLEQMIYAEARRLHKIR